MSRLTCKSFIERLQFWLYNERKLTTEVLSVFSVCVFTLKVCAQDSVTFSAPSSSQMPGFFPAAFSAPESGGEIKQMGAQLTRAEGVIAGRVVDLNGRPQPNVSVVTTATRRPGGARLEATTDAAGHFEFRGLEPGQRYLVLATATHSPVALIGRIAATPPDQDVTIEIARPFSANRTAAQAPSPETKGQSKASPGMPALPATADRTTRKPLLDQNPFATGATSPARAPAEVTRPQPTKRTRQQVVADNRMDSPWDMPAPSARKSSPQPSPQNTPSDTSDSPWRPVGSNRSVYYGTKLGHAILDSNAGRHKPDDAPENELDHGPSGETSAADPSRPLSQPIEIDEPKQNDRPRATLNNAVVQPDHKKATSKLASEPKSPASNEPMCQFEANKLVDFRLHGLDNQTVSFSEANGQLVLLDFWATWCVPCLKGIPNLVALQRKYGAQGLQVIGVACEQGLGQERVTRVRETRDQLGVNYPLALDGGENCSVRDKFGVTVFPTLILIDKSGRVLWRSDGPDQRDFQQLEKFLKSQLSSTGTRYN